MSGEREIVYFSRRGERKKRTPAKPTPALVERWAHAYVNRYYSPESSVRASLERRIRRGCEAHGVSEAEALGWADEVLTTLREAGVIDDARWAADKARALAERGVAPYGVRQRLRVKGLSSAVIDAAVATLERDRAGDAVDPRWEAAVAYARRRRLGPFRRDPATRAESFQRDLAAMARAGHGYATARTILESETLS